ncbi:hypothetical protein DPF_1106 [Desulfoplanes formicivorans]|uniref:Uncharacterized protein n=1 Tax=Desulfoplanes formicivorans TaxID=1592317 RepID=A0A194AGE5_9BACT|nr:hypothetical protein DPF_1106 [Desulfoplanes formicivorans]
MRSSLAYKECPDGKQASVVGPGRQKIPFVRGREGLCHPGQQEKKDKKHDSCVDLAKVSVVALRIL